MKTFHHHISREKLGNVQFKFLMTFEDTSNVFNKIHNYAFISKYILFEQFFISYMVYNHFRLLLLNFECYPYFRNVNFFLRNIEKITKLTQWYNENYPPSFFFCLGFKAKIQEKSEFDFEGNKFQKFSFLLCPW